MLSVAQPVANRLPIYYGWAIALVVAGGMFDATGSYTSVFSLFIALIGISTVLVFLAPTPTKRSAPIRL